MLKWFGSESVIGIELTPSQIKMVEAIPGARMRVLKVASANYFRGDRTATANQIRNLIRQEGIKAKVAHVVVSGGGSVHAMAVLPSFKKGEMQTIVERELRKTAIASAMDLAVGYQIVGQAHERGPAKNQILMIGAPKPAVQQARLLFEEAGLKVGLISTVPVALFNAIQVLELPATEGAIAHLKLGQESSYLAVIRGNLLQFSREIPIGLRAASAIESSLVERLVAEMKRTALYYRQNFRGEEIRRVILSGDEADLRPFTGPIMDELGVEISIYDPTPVLDLSQLADGPVRFRETAHNFSVPLGLAWKPRTGEAANIIAPAEKAQLTGAFTPGRAAAILLGLLIFAGMVVLYWQVRGTVQARQQRIAALNTQIQSLQPRLQQIQEEQRLREIQKVRQAFLEGMTQQGPVAAKALQEFSVLVPDEMLFHSVRVSKLPGKWQLSIDGEVIDADAPRATAVFNRFLTELRSSSFFYDAALLQPLQVSNYEEGESGRNLSFGGGMPARGGAPPRAASVTPSLPTQQIPGSVAINVPQRAAESSTQAAGGSIRRSRVEFKLGVSIASL